MTADLDKVLDRFKNELEIRCELWEAWSVMRFDEYDLKEIIYLLGELKFRREQEHDKRTDNDGLSDNSHGQAQILA